MSHAKLLQAVKDALEAFLADAEVPQVQTKSELFELKDEIDKMIDSLVGDDE